MGHFLTMHAPGDREEAEEPPGQAAAGDESRSERARRHVRRARLYAWSVLLVLALIVIVALIVSNTRQVKVSWVVGDSHASLVWVVVAAAVVGWFAGVATAVVFRHRTRAPRR
jgi:uncharacterized integral membrane protein